MTALRATAVVALAALLLVASFIWGEHFVSQTTPLQPGFPLRFPPPNQPWAPVSALLVATVVLQSICLYVLYRFVRLQAALPVRIILGLAFVATAVEAMRARAMTGTDIFAYMGYAKLSAFAHAYAPVRETLPGEFARIQLLWGNPIVPCVYGPLWLAFDRVLLSTSHTLAQGVVLLRLANFAALLVVLGSLFALRFSLAAIVTVALNPAIYRLFIVDAHNDIIGVAALALGILALSRRQPRVAFLLACAAGLVKISLVPAAVAAVTAGHTWRERTLYGGGIIAATIVVSAALGGRAYLHALGTVGASHTDIVTGLHRLLLFAAQASLVLALLAVVVAAVAQRRYVSLGSYSFVAASAWLRTWYLGWMLPYAIRAGEATLASVAIAFPVSLALVDGSLTEFLHFRMVSVAMLVVAVFIFAQLWASNGRDRRVSVQ